MTLLQALTLLLDEYPNPYVVLQGPTTYPLGPMLPVTNQMSKENAIAIAKESSGENFHMLGLSVYEGQWLLHFRVVPNLRWTEDFSLPEQMDATVWPTWVKQKS